MIFLTRQFSVFSLVFEFIYSINQSLIGIILSVVGAIALGVETKVALNWLGVGETMYRVLSWQL